MLSGVKVQIERVALAFGRTQVLRGIDLAIEPGEFFALLGPSGCGKTTLLRLIAGLERPTRGRIILEEHDITEQPAHQRNFGMVFQSLALFPHLSVGGNLAFVKIGHLLFGIVQGAGGEAGDDEVEKLLAAISPGS